jgi:hypothetical protein
MPFLHNVHKLESKRRENMCQSIHPPARLSARLHVLTVSGFRLNLVHGACFKNSCMSVILFVIRIQLRLHLSFKSNFIDFSQKQWRYTSTSPYVFVVSADIFFSQF